MTARPILDDIVAVADFESIARSLMARAAFDYVAGGAGDELTLAENLASWRRRILRPRVLVDVRALDTTTTFLGATVGLPLAIAPIAAHGLAHPDAELASARAAAAAGIPFVLSTMATRSIEEVARAAPTGIRWFQLYVQGDRAFARSLVERAAAAGYRAIVLTVDLPVLGSRERDRRNGFRLAVPLGNFPGRVRPASSAATPTDGYGVLGGQRHVGLVWEDVVEIRSWTGLPLVLKGILEPDDALRAIESGADAIVVSNHGARQLDRVAPALDVLEGIVAAVGGRIEVYVDGGVRRGSDLAIARALGARGVLVGRPVLWALAAGGEAGVARLLALFREEFETTLALLGTPTVDAIARDRVR
ncbi:MAG: alpha-hydroxy acid oxidase [Candidatus Limnocylindrales bacterium]